MKQELQSPEDHSLKSKDQLSEPRTPVKFKTVCPLKVKHESPKAGLEPRTPICPIPTTTNHLTECPYRWKRQQNSSLPIYNDLRFQIIENNLKPSQYANPPQPSFDSYQCNSIPYQYVSPSPSPLPSQLGSPVVLDNTKTCSMFTSDEDDENNRGHFRWSDEDQWEEPTPNCWSCQPEGALEAELKRLETKCLRDATPLPQSQKGGDSNIGPVLIDQPPHTHMPTPRQDGARNSSHVRINRPAPALPSASNRTAYSFAQDLQAMRDCINKAVTSSPISEILEHEESLPSATKRKLQCLQDRQRAFRMIRKKKKKIAYWTHKTSIIQQCIGQLEESCSDIE
ncbi:hypothetical protein FA15DRAFT_708669 [Coprinopsis marcescibilis]|uniref:Uncharacterized protein n=1 Tax=Coprinopsis marcescibilis TaxID=230819 RepID=A0A5C3KI98_COPMA|nr:hypothetical protein FA15DRAFT_708669 [Coprinopsis marcescibilis]